MNVDEVWGLTDWVQQHIQSAGLVKRYRALHGILQSNLQPNTEDQPFETQKDELLAALRAVPLHALTNEQLDVLERIGIRDHVGDAAASAVEDLLYRNVLDAATAAQNIEAAAQAIAQGVQAATNMRESLAVWYVPLESDDPRVRLRVSFRAETELRSVVELRRWINKWYEIARGIALAHDLPPESVALVGASRGSVVLEFAVDPTFAATVGFIMAAALKVTERVFEIRKTAAEVRNLDLQNKQIEQELESSAKTEHDQGLQSITDQVRIRLDIQANGEGEKLNALSKAVSRLLEFLSKRGEVDLLLPPAAEEPGENDPEGAENGEILAELRAQAEAIRQLESKLRLLGSGDGSSSDAADELAEEEPVEDGEE